MAPIAGEPVGIQSKEFKAHAGLIDASEMEETDTYSEHTAWPGFRWGPEHGVLYPNSQFPIEALNQYLRPA